MNRSRVRMKRALLCWVLSHDAAGFVCGGAGRPAYPRLRRAGADPGESACRRGLPCAITHTGGRARRDDVSDAACIDPGKSARRNDGFSAALQSRDPDGINSRPRKPVHAPGVADADGRDRFGAQRFPVHGCAHSRPSRGAPSQRKLRRRARPRSATILAQRFSPTPSSPPPRRRNAIQRLWTRAAGQPTSRRSAPERRGRLC